MVTILLLSALKATLLVGVALLLVTCARRASAALRHAILVTAVAGSLLLPLLAATLPAFTPAAVANRPVSMSPQWQRWSDNAVRLVMTRSYPESNSLPQSGVRTAVERHHASVLVIWLAGTALALTRIILDLFAAYRTRKRATFRGRLDVGIPLLESAEIGAPVAVGLFRPAIMLRTGTALDSAMLRPMIRHERAHIERRDCLTQLIVRIACALYWFNPLVWHAAQRIALEREGACDDHALASGVDPIDYSELLINVARKNAHAPLRLHAAPLLPHAAHLEKRIVRILDGSTRRGGISRARLVALVLATAAVVAPLAALGVHDGVSAADILDIYFDPQCERIPGVREHDPGMPPVDINTPDGALVATLHGAASHEPQSSTDLVADRARWALSMVHDGRLIEPLIGSLHDPDWRVRAYAAWALSISGDPRAVEPLIPLLDHSVWRVRAMAAAALRQFGDERAAAAMEAALDDPAWQVRVEAVAFLGALDRPNYARRIESLRNDPHIAVRFAAAEVLDNIQ